MTRRPPTKTPIPRPQDGEYYLGGGTPVGWLEQASCLGGKAVNVGIMIWHLAIMSKSGEVSISVSKVSRRMGFDRATGSRALRRLEERGLIEVQRPPGCSPIVRLRWPPKPIRAAAESAAHDVGGTTEHAER